MLVFLSKTKANELNYIMSNKCTSVAFEVEVAFEVF